MNLQYLRVFLSVAEHEHITKASEELILSQPAVTKTIQNLEREVGLELIERHGRRIVLTHAGHVLHVYAKRVFALEREMEDALEALRDVDTGEVTLAANPTTGVYLLPPIIANFRARYPKVQLHMSILNSHEIVERTLDWQLDFGLVEVDPANLSPELQVEVFAQDELMLVVGPQHHWRGVQALRPEALKEGELLLREQGSGVREAIEKCLAHHGVQVTPLLTVPDDEVMKQMVLNGIGAAILSSFAVRRELASGELVHVPLAGIELRPQISIVRRVDKKLSRASEAFCGLVRTLMDAD